MERSLLERTGQGCCPLDTLPHWPPHHIKHGQLLQPFFRVPSGLLIAPAPAQATGWRAQSHNLCGRQALFNPISRHTVPPGAPHVASQHVHWLSQVSGVEHHSEQIGQGCKMPLGQEAMKCCSDNCDEDGGSALSPGQGVSPALPPAAE